MSTNKSYRTFTKLFLLTAFAVGGIVVGRVSSGTSGSPILQSESTVDKTTVVQNAGKTEFAFSPGKESTKLVSNVIRSATKTIRVSAYSFTSKPLADDLVAAHRKGVDVKVVLDKSNVTSMYSVVTVLTAAGIPTRIDSKHPIAHSKYMVVDERTVETGSFNYTKSAIRNSENVVVFWNSPEIAKTYSGNWELHWEHSSSLTSMIRNSGND